MKLFYFRLQVLLMHLFWTRKMKFFYSRLQVLEATRMVSSTKDGNISSTTGIVLSAIDAFFFITENGIILSVTGIVSNGNGTTVPSANDGILSRVICVSLRGIGGIISDVDDRIISSVYDDIAEAVDGLLSIVEDSNYDAINYSRIYGQFSCVIDAITLTFKPINKINEKALNINYISSQKKKC